MKTMLYLWGMKNKETTQEIISNEINERLSQLIEEMSTNEFIDLICDKVYTETGIDYTDEQREEITSQIGEQVFPLLMKLMEHVSGIPLPLTPISK